MNVDEPQNPNASPSNGPVAPLAAASAPPGSQPTIQSRPASAPAPDFGMGSGTNATLGMMPFVNTPREDLSGDGLLTMASRLNFNGADVPSLGGIPLLSKLGQGGMGAVYFGIHPRLRMEVAVKVLPFQMASQQPALVQRFYREAQIAARVKSPHLVGVMDVNEEKGLFYLVMEYVDGVSAGSHVRKLRQLNSSFTGLQESTALDICIAATAGLVCAHANSVIHRDIKPDNILIPKQTGAETPHYDLAKLADLGLARCDDGDSSLTNAQSTMGTPGFMAPEQANDAKSAGKPADVFSMGATLYSLLTGQPPFQENTSLATILAAIQKPHTPLTKYRTDISIGTQDLIDRCLAKEPGKRYADASELLEQMKICRAALNASTVTMVGAAHAARSATGNVQTLIGSRASQPSSSSVVDDGGMRASIQSAARTSVPPVRPASPGNKGMLTLIALIIAVPALIGAGWVGYSHFNKPVEVILPPPPQTHLLTGTETGTAVVSSTLTSTATATSTSKDVGDPLQLEKDREARAEAEKQAAIQAGIRTARYDEMKKRVDEDRKVAADAQKRAVDADAALAKLADQARKAETEWETLNTQAQAAQKSMREAAAAIEKARAEIKQAETELESSVNRPLLHARAKIMADRATQDLTNAQNQHKIHEADRDKFLPQAKTAFRVRNEAMEERDRADGAAKGARAEAEAAKLRGDQSAADLRDFTNLNKSTSIDAPGKGTGTATATNTNAAAGPAISGAYKLYDGPYKVIVSDGSLHDGKRAKDLAYRVYQPDDSAGGSFPIVVFSHGWLASKDNYAILANYWAGHGYVVILPTHADSLSTPDGIKQALEKHDPYADPKALENRFADLDLIMDSFRQIETRNQRQKESWDIKHVAVTGHSLGAYTAMVVGGATVHLTGVEQTTFKDKRVDAILVLSPQGHGEGGLDENSWKSVHKPMYAITGTADNGFKKQAATWRNDPFQLSAPGDKYQLVMDGAQHGLGGITGNGGATPKFMEKILGPDVPEQRDWVRTSSLAFLDAYLKNDMQAKAYLNSDALKNIANGKLTFERR